MRSLACVHRFPFFVACGLWVLVHSGCGDSASSMQWSVQQDGATTGPVPQAELQQKVLQGELPFDIMIRPEGSSEEWTPIDKAIPSFARERTAATWARALNEYAKWGDPGKIAESSVEKSNHALWLNAGEPPRKPGPGVLAIIEKSKELVDPLIALDGAWSPVLEVGGKPVSSRSIRGLGRTIWGDLRYALVTNDHDRVVADLLLMANLPRVAAGSDPSQRGFMTTLATMGIFGWGLSDVEMYRQLGDLPGDWSISPEAYRRVQTAAGWAEQRAPFDAEAEANKVSWNRFQSRELGRIRALLQQLGN
ncbi:MAG: hypothetical protein MK085_10100 [Phycisphaerales bacterium]|nr:hypothetical protein [Phycisphaerales bacterium]